MGKGIFNIARFKKTKGSCYRIDLSFTKPVCTLQPLNVSRLWSLVSKLSPARPGGHNPGGTTRGAQLETGGLRLKLNLKLALIFNHLQRFFFLFTKSVFGLVFFSLVIIMYVPG